MMLSSMKTRDIFNLKNGLSFKALVSQTGG